jgi:hypothetical protein
MERIPTLTNLQKFIKHNIFENQTDEKASIFSKHSNDYISRTYTYYYKKEI